MRFVIRSIHDDFPEAPMGPPGEELAAYMPLDMEWRQLNYGQGEGQIEANGCEWGFYWTATNRFSVVLHRGTLDAENAILFVRAVARVVAQSKVRVVVEIEGDDTTSAQASSL